MSFVGDLEHLPIVDLIQLLHSTKKSGTLALKSNRGESQLVFNDGFIVSANHYNNSIRVGQILVDMNAITSVQLDQTLQEQKSAGKNRAPIIATLIEKGIISKDSAYKGLEMLLEMTIVDVLTWTSGTFELEMDKLVISDEYRYFPDTLKQTLNLNTQSILMDALRIYDEKMRDGTLTEATFAGDHAEIEMQGLETEHPLISAADLGLDDLDNLEKKIPEVFMGFKSYDPAETFRKRLKEDLQDLPSEKQEKLISYLVKHSEKAKTTAGNESTATLAVIALSCDNLITHSVLTACKSCGVAVFTTDEEVNLDPIINQVLSKNLQPLLVIDTCSRFSPDLIERKKSANANLSIIQLFPARDQESALQALNKGVRTVFPKPDKTNKDTLIEDTIEFIETFRSYLNKSTFSTIDHSMEAFTRCIRELGNAKEKPDLAFALLRFTANIFERSITFIVGNGELIAERAIGIEDDKNSGAKTRLHFKLSLTQTSVFKQAIDNLEIHYGHGSDEVLKNLYQEIGNPTDTKIILVPIISFDRVIALIYADFGQECAKPVPIEIIASLAKHASLIFDNIIMRKKFVIQPQRQ